MSRTRHHSKRYWKGSKAKLWFDGGWLCREPKEWRRLYKHKPRRAKTKQALHKSMQGDEDVIFPLDGKPWIYYY